MSNYNEMIDTKRIEAAKNAQAALVLAERDAIANAATAKAAAVEAERAASRAARDGADAGRLTKLEMTLEGAQRQARVADRMATAATSRRQAGESTLAAETKMAHAKAISTALKRRLELVEMADRLTKELAAAAEEFNVVSAEAHHLHHAGVGPAHPGLKLHLGLIAGDGKPIELDWFKAVTAGAGCGPDGRLPWMSAE